jgi:phosphate/phosphite/phosphonate ABC transporter binding protein
MINRISLSLFFCVYAAFSTAQSSLSNQQTLVIGTYQYDNNDRIKNIQPFASHFSDVTEVQTVVKSFPTVHQLVQSMKAGEIDIAFMNTFGYLMLREQTQAYEISAALHLPDQAASVYKTVIVTPRENQIKSLKDGISNAGDNLLILVSSGSTSGNLVPRLKIASMMENEPEMFFLEVQYAGTHQLALQNMVKEKFALAAFGSDEYYKLGADTVHLTKLWESGAIPLGPVICKKQLSENVKSSLQKILLELHKQNAKALESLKAGWTEAIPADQFMLIDDSYYESLINLSGNKERSMKIIRKFAR